MSRTQIVSPGGSGDDVGNECSPAIESPLRIGRPDLRSNTLNRKCSGCIGPFSQQFETAFCNKGIPHRVLLPKPETQTVAGLS